MGQLLNKRYQFIKALGSDAGSHTLLVGDTKAKGHPRCVVKQLQLPTSNPRTLEFSLILLKKKSESLKTIGSHLQIPGIIECFYENQSFYLVEEFIAGESLDTKIVPGQPWSAAAVTTVLREVLTVLQFVHERHIVHRRIKPSNLIERKSDGRIALAGFGVFREISAQVLRSHDRLLPAHGDEMLYIAPEQAIGKAQPASDLYALGMVAIQALSGRTPADLSQRQNASGTQPAQFDWDAELDLPPQLVSLLNRLVHPLPQERYQTAAEVLLALAPLGSEVPVPAITPPPPPPPPRSRLERNGYTVAAAANGVARAPLPILAATAADAPAAASNGQTRIDVNTVVEIDMIGQVMHFDPFNRRVIVVTFPDRLQFCAVLQHFVVAGDAGFGLGNACKG